MKNNKKKIAAFVLAIASFVATTGCSFDNTPVSSPEPETTTTLETTTIETTAETTAVADESGTEPATEAPAEKKVSVDSIVEQAKTYIKDKGTYENKTTVEWGSSESGSSSGGNSKATLESGFNPNFYYIIEKSNDSNTNYTLYVNNDWGYIYTLGQNYKIKTDLILLECSLKNFQPDTLAEMIIGDIILDTDNCELSEDDKYYYIDQRLEYKDLAINRANSCSFTGINDDESIRQKLTFDKETGAMLKSEVKCKVLDVSSNTENYVNVEAEYTYEQTHEFPSGVTENCEEIDGFHGYSIY